MGEGAFPGASHLLIGLRSPCAGVQSELPTASWSSVTSPAARRLLECEYAPSRPRAPPAASLPLPSRQEPARVGAKCCAGAGSRAGGAGPCCVQFCSRGEPGRSAPACLGSSTTPSPAPFTPIFLTCRPRSSPLLPPYEGPHSYTVCRCLGLRFSSSSYPVVRSRLCTVTGPRPYSGTPSLRYLWKRTAPQKLGLHHVL